MMRDMDLNKSPQSENVNTTLELGLPSVELISHQDNADDGVVNRSMPITYEEFGFAGGQTGSPNVSTNAVQTVPTTPILDDGLITQSARREESDFLKVEIVALPQASSVSPTPQQRAPRYICPICMDELVEETTTKCGHVFCRMCIRVAIAYDRKCPTCRRKVTTRDIFRIYLSDNNR